MEEESNLCKTSISSGGHVSHTVSHEEEEEEEKETSSSSCIVHFESDDDSRPFVPYVDIKVMEESFLISTVTLKDVALTSALFRVLEQEKPDIVFENHHRTENKVAYTIQVRAKAELDADALGKKLLKWAKGSQP